MMVVVQFFAADQDGNRHEIRRGVLRFEIAVADGVAKAIDDAGREEDVYRDRCGLITQRH